MARFPDASPYYCGEEYPERTFIDYHNQGEPHGRLRVDRFCLKLPGHVARGEPTHRDVDGREWS